MPDPSTTPVPKPLPSLNSQDSSKTSDASPSPVPVPTPTPAPDRVVIITSIVPDFCKMPNGAIVPFDLLGTYKDTQNESCNVFSNQHGTSHIDATLFKCTGDESSVGGVKSGTIAGTVKLLPNGSRVKVNGKQCTREHDLASMNCGNTIGMIYVIDAVGESINSPYGSAIGEYSKNVAANKTEIEKYKRAKNKLKANENRKFKNSNRRQQSNAAFKRQMENATKRMSKSFPLSKNLPIATGALRHLPVVGLGYSTYKAGDALAKGDDKQALTEASKALVGAGVGAGGMALCGALSLAGGFPGLACAGAVIVASTLASAGTEYAINADVSRPTDDEYRARGMVPPRQVPAPR